MSECFAVPRDFYCEFGVSKSRVLAVVDRPDGPTALHAVLTCKDHTLADRICRLLSGALEGGHGPALDAELDRLAGELPDAPASSLRQAFDHACRGAWWDTQVRVSWTDVGVETHGPDDPSPAILDGVSRTPIETRLADLSGDVVRIFQLVELHVHDSDKLMRSARALGWEPAHGDGEGDRLGDDVVLAAMELAGVRGPVPGADVITDSARGQLLLSTRGDEVADWSEVSICVEFGTGRLLAIHGRSVGEERPDTSRPSLEFAGLFPVGDRDCECDEEGCEVCESWYLTPRTADLLHTALCLLGDEAVDDVETHGDTPVPGKNEGTWAVFDRLPRITWSQKQAWRHDFARACDDLASDLKLGRWPTPRSIAEEVALHLAIQDGPALLDIETEAQDEDSSHASLPRHRDDYDWDECLERLFQDWDVLLLFEAEMDGIEDPDQELNRRANIGDLRPAKWFAPFNNVEPRDPKRDSAV